MAEMMLQTRSKRREQDSDDPHGEERDAGRAAAATIVVSLPPAAPHHPAPRPVRQQRHGAGQRGHDRHETNVEIADVAHLMRQHASQLRFVGGSGDSAHVYKDRPARQRKSVDV